MAMLDFFALSNQNIIQFLFISSYNTFGIRIIYPVKKIIEVINFKTDILILWSLCFFDLLYCNNLIP